MRFFVDDLYEEMQQFNGRSHSIRWPPGHGAFFYGVSDAGFQVRRDAMQQTSGQRRGKRIGRKKSLWKLFDEKTSLFFLIGFYYLANGEVIMVAPDMGAEVLKIEAETLFTPDSAIMVIALHCNKNTNSW